MRTSISEGGPVSGERLVTWRRSAAVHGTGRVCSVPECTTRLSIYNSTNRCSLHRTFVTIVPRNPGSNAQDS